MTTPDFIGHLGNLGFLLGAYLIASRKKSGFFALGWGNCSYIIQGFLVSTPSLVIISFYLFAMNIYGYINWLNNERRNQK